jgi:hypothetical protein
METCNLKGSQAFSNPFIDRARLFSGVFWILPLVGVRRCLSRAEGLSLIPLRKNKTAHTKKCPWQPN